MTDRPKAKVQRIEIRPSRETIGERVTTHGHTTNHILSPTYRSWSSMMTRCTNRNHQAYARYGGRGITVCDAWLKFENFLADMGERPSRLTLDRIDATKGYSPENCRWASYAEQRRNQPRNRTVERSDGLRFRTMIEAAEATGSNRRCIRDVCVGRQKTHLGFTWRFVS